MKVLITGSSGFIGKNITFPDVVYIDIKDGLNLLTCDLPKDIDVIIHLAAQTSVESSWQDPVNDIDNLKMVVRLVNNYPNAKIIYTNSCAALSPKSPYGFSKWACAEYLKTFHRQYVNLVLPNVYGVGSKSVVDIFRTHKNVTIFGDGKAIRDYVHVFDIREAIIKAIKWDYGTYMLGSGIGTKVLDLLDNHIVTYDTARKEERKVVLKNTTPNWKHTINVIDYLKWKNK